MKPRQVLEIFTAAQRKTEPKSLVILRSFIAILFFTILICYMFVQIEDVRLDTPIFSIVQSHEEEKAIPMPNVYFAYDHQFTVSCQINGRITKVSQEDCLTYIQQPVLSSTDDQTYLGTFKANGLKFIRSDIEKIDFIFTINNLSNEILADDLGIEIRIFDSEAQDPLDNFKEANAHVADIFSSLIDLNLYHLFSQQHHTVELGRIKRKIAKEFWWNILGIPPTFVDETHINSHLEVHPLLGAPANSYSKLSFVMRTWRVPLEKEQKAKTLFDTFGQIAGVAGTLSLLYAFLFGAGPSAIQTWGVVQKMKCFGIKKGVRKHINRRYPRLPFIHTSEDNEIIKSNDYDEVIERLDAVERFLKEYVVDADFLAQIEKLDNENKNKT
ncbi:hypothetical protein C1646_808883 [Rhizophagus diaphanus]|nr:hypothetical protein C1646_808883 [Rhizophagus diaphanus] [Rhizophagus sp. MUCL 43196]